MCKTKKEFLKNESGHSREGRPSIFYVRNNSYPRPNFTKWIGRSLQDLGWPEINAPIPDYHTEATVTLSLQSHENTMLI